MLVKIYLPKRKIYKDKKKLFDKDSIYFCVLKMFLKKIEIFLFFII